MILRDWRDAQPDLLRACYARELRHWRTALAWDTEWTWATVERARTDAGLPGFLACDPAGDVRGWAFHTTLDDTVHLGGLVADTPHATDALLDGVLDAAVAQRASAAACFILDRAAGLGDALASRGFAVEPYAYLSRRLETTTDVARAPAFGEAWRDDDIAGAARLLQAAYTVEDGRHFAPHGRRAEWVRYAAGLAQQAGCGVMSRSLTRVLRDEAGLRALALVTTVAERTAHLAQVAVRPEQRGQGIASALIADAMHAAAAEGMREMTLLVGATNAPARRLYAALGFTNRATFIAARRTLDPAAYVRTRAAS